MGGGSAGGAGSPAATSGARPREAGDGDAGGWGPCCGGPAATARLASTSRDEPSALGEEREGGEVDLECGARVSAGIYLAWEEQQHRWIEDLTLRKILNDVATLRPRRGHNKFTL